MKVFGIGFPRTGTTTLNRCFKQFGFSHKGYDLDLLRRVHEDDLAPVRAVTEQHDSFDDWPWPLLYRRLDEWYPDAKFILTIRERPDVWLQSMQRHAKLTGPTEARQIVFGNPRVEGQEEMYVDRYTRHNEEVRSYFHDRPDDLLEVCWEAGTGWDELCTFLNVDVPDRPLPHTSRNTVGKWLRYAPDRWERHLRELLGLRLG